MSGLRLLTDVAIVTLIVAPCSHAQSETPADLLIQGNTQFALELYSRIAHEEGNIAVSPLSVSVAMAMLYAGAAGETERELASAAHFTLPQETFHVEFAALLDELSLRVAPWAELLLANGLWTDRRCRLLDGYRSVVQDRYGAKLDTVDFASAPGDACDRINRFVSEQTGGRIPSVVDPAMFSELTRVVVANTVYFLAAWNHAFDESRTREEPLSTPNLAR